MKFDNAQHTEQMAVVTEAEYYHFARCENQGSRLGLSDTHDNSCKSLQTVAPTDA